MTALQKEAMDLIPEIPDEKMYYILQIIRGIKGLELNSPSPKRIIGLAQGEVFLADGYDMDADGRGEEEQDGGIDE